MLSQEEQDRLRMQADMLRRSEEEAEAKRRQEEALAATQEGGGSDMSSLMNIPYAKEAAAMYGLVKAGDELGIGGKDQMDFYQEIIPDDWEKKLQQLMPWEWF